MRELAACAIDVHGFRICILSGWGYICNLVRHTDNSIHFYVQLFTCFFCQFVLLGAVPFPTDVLRLKALGVGGVVTLNEPYETLVPASLYHVFYNFFILILNRF